MKFDKLRFGILLKMSFYCDCDKSKVYVKSKGFSLVEVLITMGILSMLSLGIGTVAMNGQRTAQSQTSTTQFNSLITMLQSSTQNDSSCTSMFNINGNFAQIDTQQGAVTHLPVALGNTILAGASPTPTAISGVSPVSQYGSLSIQDIYLTVTSPSPIPIASDSPVVNINANLVVVANKSGYNSSNPSSSTNFGSAQLSNASTPIQLTLQMSGVSGKNNTLTLNSCTGLRVGNLTQFNLPVCAAGQAVTSNGTQLTCSSSRTILFSSTSSSTYISAKAGYTANCPNLTDGIVGFRLNLSGGQMASVQVICAPITFKSSSDIATVGTTVQSFNTVDSADLIIDIPTSNGIYVKDGADAMICPPGMVPYGLGMNNNNAFLKCGQFVLSSLGGYTPAVYGSPFGDYFVRAYDDIKTNMGELYCNKGDVKGKSPATDGYVITGVWGWGTGAGQHFAILCSRLVAF